MALMAWTHDPLLSGLEKAMDKAFDRAIGSRELGAFLPTFAGHNGAGAHPMVSCYAFSYGFDLNSVAELVYSSSHDCA